MKWLRKVWTDPVGSKLIASAIGSLFVLIVQSLPHIEWRGSLTQVGFWVNQPLTLTLTRGQWIANALTIVAVTVALLGLYIGILAKRQAQHEAAASSQVELQVPAGEPQDVPQFAPETFELTPRRCRAMLFLLSRVDAKTDLDQIHRTITRVGASVDPDYHKGLLQHDLDAAERVGLIEIDRVGDYTQHFRIAAPLGRDWLLEREGQLRVESRKGMTKVDIRNPRYW